MKQDLTGMARLGDGMMRTAPLLHLPALLTSMRVNPAALLRSAGLKKSALSQPDNTIPVRKAVRLMVAGAERTGQPHFGLLVGQRISLKQLGLIGLRMMHAPSVGAAWRGLVLTLHLNDRVNVPALMVRERVATLSFTPYAVESPGVFHVMDYTLAAACVAMRALCGPTWAPAEVHLAHRAPADERPYQSFFQAPVYFGATNTALLFPAQLLDRRIVGSDPAVRK
jgi:hypothetical protein